MQEKPLYAGAPVLEDILLREAIAADEAAIRKMISSMRLNPMSLHWQNFIVAQDRSGGIAGIGQVKQHGDGSRELASIGVSPDMRRRGVASAVIGALLAREKGTLYLMCRDALGPFYARFGFQSIGPGEMPPYFARAHRFVNALQWLSRSGVRVLIMKRTSMPLL